MSTDIETSEQEPELSYAGSRKFRATKLQGELYFLDIMPLLYIVCVMIDFTVYSVLLDTLYMFLIVYFIMAKSLFPALITLSL